MNYSNKYQGFYVTNSFFTQDVTHTVTVPLCLSLVDIHTNITTVHHSWCHNSDMSSHWNRGRSLEQPWEVCGPTSPPERELQLGYSPESMTQQPPLLPFLLHKNKVMCQMWNLVVNSTTCFWCHHKQDPQRLRAENCDSGTTASTKAEC